MINKISADIARDAQLKDVVAAATDIAVNNVPVLPGNIEAHILLTVLSYLAPVLSMNQATPEILELKRLADNAVTLTNTIKATPDVDLDKLKKPKDDPNW